MKKDLRGEKNDRMICNKMLRKRTPLCRVGLWTHMMMCWTPCCSWSGWWSLGWVKMVKICRKPRSFSIKKTLKSSAYVQYLSRAVGGSNTPAQQVGVKNTSAHVRGLKQCCCCCCSSSEQQLLQIEGECDTRGESYKHCNKKQPNHK